MRVAIVGSSYLSEEQLREVRHLCELILFTECDEQVGDVEVVSGGAPGVDTIAAEVAKDVGLDSMTFRPEVFQWEDLYEQKFGGLVRRRGFRSRNLQIAEYCDTLYCVRSTESQTYGSGWTADRTEELGKRVYRYFV